MIWRLGSRLLAVPADADGTPLTEWQPKGCLRPRPPSIVDGCFPPDHFADGDPLQLWYNDGWWECVVVPKPNTSKREAKARIEREKVFRAAVDAAEAAGEAPPELPPGLGGDMTVKVCASPCSSRPPWPSMAFSHPFSPSHASLREDSMALSPLLTSADEDISQFVHYPEVHPNINSSQVSLEFPSSPFGPSPRANEERARLSALPPVVLTARATALPPRQVRPSWVCRNGEWFWRLRGGVLQYLTNRMADGKTSRDGMIKPMWKKTFVPGGVPINLLLDGARCVHLPAAPAFHGLLSPSHGCLSTFYWTVQAAGGSSRRRTRRRRRRAARTQSGSLA